MSAGPAGLRALFHPRSIALVGASDRSGWSAGTFGNLRGYGFPGPVHLVNPRSEIVHGEKACASLADVPGPVDLAFVMVPTDAVLPVLRAGAEAGIPAYVVLTSGFGETGAGGARREAEVAAFARDRGLTILGPNGNGYINAAAGITPYGLPIPPPLLRGPVGVVLQSGALASSVLTFAQARNIGVSLLVSMGNESMLSVADVVGYLVDDPDTRVIALFLESVRQPEKFAAAARRALAAGKPVVALKVGRSDLARHTAQAHTGALVGDDGVVDAVFRQLGIARVRSIEDLIITAGLLAAGPLPGPRLGVVTPSGGASEIIADRAQDEGLDLPAFAPATAAALAAILPAFATVANPLDVTGYVVKDRTLLGRALEIVAADPGIDSVLLLSELPRDVPADPPAVRVVFEATAARIAAAPRPVTVVSNTLTDITGFGREFQASTGYPPVAGGIEHGIQAIGAAVRWSRAHRAALAVPVEPAPGPPNPPGRPGEAGGDWAGASGTWGEDRAAALLAAHGVPVVPTERAADEAAAVEAAGSLGYPVVVKAVSATIAHKTDIGAVRLAVPGAGAVRAAYRDVRAAACAAGGEDVRVLVQPYRTGGIELIAGVVQDPAWGLVLAVGLGGVWVEVLRDAALRVLPVGPEEIRCALGELRGAAVLRGARGAEPADLDRVADVIARIAAAAVHLGDRLESLEVNPLLVRGAHVEALDALITWRS
ncbi:MAG TPA: acetate--CoA ligase family protein [Streptosporangiaceae bacterium]